MAVCFIIAVSLLGLFHKSDCQTVTLEAPDDVVLGQRMTVTCRFTDGASSSNTVDNVDWSFSGASTGFTVVVSPSCSVFGTIPPEYSGMSITPSCGTNEYSLVFPSVEQSTVDKTWCCNVVLDPGPSPSPAKCDTPTINCGSLTNPSGGTVSTPTTVKDSKATYTCNDGYTMEGSAIRTCQPDGTWSGSAPTCTAALTKSCFSQAGCTAGVVLGSIYGTSWLVAIVVNLVIYCMNQMLLAWNLCDGPMKRLWIWILLFIFLPYIPSVISIYLFRTNRPAKKPTSGMELEKNGTP